jgi:hypothetical protein
MDFAGTSLDRSFRFELSGVAGGGVGTAQTVARPAIWISSWSWLILQSERKSSL